MRNKVEKRIEKCLLRETGALLVFAAILLISPRLIRAELVCQTIYEFFPQPGQGTVPINPIAQGPDGNFYGTKCSGPWSINYDNYGAVFKVSPSGVFTHLATFGGTNGSSPSGGLTLGKDGCLYGPTYNGGNDFAGFNFSGYGTVFKITTNGELISLAAFNGTNGGSLPNAPLCAGSDGYLYGTAQGVDGRGDKGSIFRVSTNGELTKLYSFNGSDGQFVVSSGLVEGPDGAFYGMTPEGGPNFYGTPFGLGTVFKITTNGVLTSLVAFNATNGSKPFATLALGSDQNFYGTTSAGGAYGLGTVFKMSPDGILTTLISFDGTNGATPYNGVTRWRDGNFYGTTPYRRLGTNLTYGTIYKITTNGALTTIAYSDGTNSLNPTATFILAKDGNLYGALSDVNKWPAPDGNIGSIIRLVEPPVISSITSSSNDTLTLSWSSFTNGVYQVQSASSPAAATWSTIETQVTATGTTASLTIPAAETPEQYFRVQLLP